MTSKNKSILSFALVVMAILFFSPTPGVAQVSPAEILNPHLKAVEQTYLTKLMAVNRAIAELGFPFAFSLNRYVGLDPKEQVGSDMRGLEFVDFHEQLVLKVSGNYNAAFNADRLTPNQRSARVFNDVVVPILQLLPKYFSAADDFDAIGFEISYHVRRQARHYDYEGKEILAAVLSKADALTYTNVRDDLARQEVLNRSDINMNGKPFGLALGASEPFDVATLVRPVRSQSQVSANRKPNSANVESRAQARQDTIPDFERPVSLTLASNVRRELQVAPLTAVSRRDADRLQAKYQGQLDALAKEGATSYSFVQYAPPSFVIFRDQIHLQLTMRNPVSFDKEGTSIYKRTAQSFDLFLAPQLKHILEQVPDDIEISGVDITVLDDFTVKSGHSSEALEFICPSKLLRQFANAEITNQELINQSVVLVNGVRIAVTLQQVE